MWCRSTATPPPALVPAARVPDLDTRTCAHQAILETEACPVDGFRAGRMPADSDRISSDTQFSHILELERPLLAPYEHQQLRLEAAA